MSGGLIKAVLDLLNALVKDFANATPLASVLTIAVPAVAIFLAIREHIHRRVKSKDGKILDLSDDLRRKEKKLDDARHSLEQAEERYGRLLPRLPEHALELHDKEMLDQNFQPANRALLDWLEEEGEAASMVLLHRAEWAIAHAVQDLRAPGLVAAEACAIGAVALDPANERAMSLLNDVIAMREAEGQIMPPLQQSLTEIDARASELFDIDLFRDADEAEAEAYRRYDQGHYSAALPLVQRAVFARMQTIGKFAIPTFRIRLLQALLLDQLGRSDEALAIAQDVAAKGEQHPDLGPQHPSTLASRHLVAQILHTLGRSDEALAIAQDVAAKEEQHPDLGPQHPSTLASRYLVAQILNTLGRSDEALAIAQEVAAKEEQHPDLGPQHPSTLVSRYLVAQILNNLGRSDEALAIAQDVAAKGEQHPDLGPQHPSTLASRYLVAQILNTLGRSDEALAIAQDVAAKGEQHPDLGPQHPSTLASRYLVAQILNTLGRSDEALAIAQDVAAKGEQHPDLGPQHPSTLVSRHLVAQILDNLGRSDEALAIAQDVAAKEEQHPDLGPQHPSTLNSRRLVERIAASQKG